MMYIKEHSSMRAKALLFFTRLYRLLPCSSILNYMPPIFLGLYSRQVRQGAAGRRCDVTPPAVHGTRHLGPDK